MTDTTNGDSDAKISIFPMAESRHYALASLRLLLGWLNHPACHRKDIDVIYYRQYIGDYLRDTAHLSLLEHGIYRRLIDEYYLKEFPLPKNNLEIYRQIRARGKIEREAVDNLLNEFFYESQEGWRHKRCDEEIAKYNAKSNKAKESANARWNNANASLNNHANASETHCVGNASHKSVVNIIKDVKSASNVTLYEPKSLTAPELKKAGVNVNSANVVFQKWIKDGFTMEVILKAIGKAREFKPSPELIPVNYLDKILREKP